eukprot:317645-Amphidinium_carterae.1
MLCISIRKLRNPLRIKSKWCQTGKNQIQDLKASLSSVGSEVRTYRKPESFKKRDANDEQYAAHEHATQHAITTPPRRQLEGVSVVAAGKP